MLNKHILTAKGSAFMILHPAELEVNNDLLNELISSGDKEHVYIYKENWLHYQPDGDDDVYSWELPGIKLVFSGEINFDDAKKITDEVVKKLKANSGMELSLVVIDKTKLANL